MRIILKISSNTAPVPFDYQKILVGAFHKWLGENLIHDEISLYSLSWLYGGKRINNGLSFQSGGEWHISSYDTDLLKKLIMGIKDDPTINFGMAVRNISIIQPPDFGNNHRFYLNSPVFVKRNENGRIRFFLYKDKETGQLMTQTMITKMKKAGIDHEGLKISFDKTYQNPKTKKISFGGIDCRASFCPVIVEGTPEQLAFAWSVGVGNSTGIGFGALR
jgi:CRISPR-associated endoribonuclease Cas6